MLVSLLHKMSTTFARYTRSQLHSPHSRKRLETIDGCEKTDSLVDRWQRLDRKTSALLSRDDGSRRPPRLGSIIDDSQALSYASW